MKEKRGQHGAKRRDELRAEALRENLKRRKSAAHLARNRDDLTGEQKD